MKTNNYFKLLLLLLVVSCGSSNETINQLVTVNLTETSLDKTVEMPEGTIKIKNLRITPLECTENSMLGYRAMVMADEDGTLVIQDDEQKIIYLFDSNSGKFISSINRQGRSNEEYLGLNYVSADVKNRELAVNDLMGNKIVIYDFDGNYLRSHKSDSLISYDYVGNDKFVGYNANVVGGADYTYNFCLYDRNFNLIKGLDERTSNDVPITYWKPVYADRDNVYIRDTVYTLKDDQLVPLVAINKGEYKLPSDISLRDEASHKYISSDDAHLVGKYLLYRSFRRKDMKNVAEIWDLKEGKLLRRRDINADGAPQILLPFEYEGVTISLWSSYISYIGEGGRIYSMLSMSDIEKLGIDNNDNPVIVSYEIE